MRCIFRPTGLPRRALHFSTGVHIRSRIGINGEPIVFNAKRVQEPSKKRPTSSGHGKYDDLILALGQLGLTVTKEQVATAVAALPNQGSGLDEASLVKAVFLHMKKTG